MIEVSSDYYAKSGDLVKVISGEPVIIYLPPDPFSVSVINEGNATVTVKTQDDRDFEGCIEPDRVLVVWSNHKNLKMW